MLTHIDEKNNPKMVNISEKVVTERRAKAQTKVKICTEILKQFDGVEIQSKKGPVFQTARIAGTMAIKKTSELIPFCHPLPIEGCRIDIEIVKNEVYIECEVLTHYKTGVEMEALVGAQVAALTVYDMCKALSHRIELVEGRLLEKTGGKNDFRG